jgi:hypothetical protein
VVITDVAIADDTTITGTSSLVRPMAITHAVVAFRFAEECLDAYGGPRLVSGGTHVTKDAATSYCVGIVLRNLNTGVETLLTQPTFPKIESNFETRWFLPYRTNPAFREFDVMPVLDNPALHLDKLFTTCVFPTRDGQMLQAMAFLVHEKDSVLKGFPGVHDHVYIDILLPNLPLSSVQYGLLMDEQRRFYALQYAFLCLATKDSDMRVFPVTDPAGANTFKMDALTATLFGNEAERAIFSTLHWDAHRIKMAFRLPATEKTAGSSVIPAVLKKLYFLIPGLDAKQDIYYDILQGHKYAYTFRIRNLAGWTVLGSVNAALPNFSTTNACFNQFVPSTEHQLITSPDLLTVYPQDADVYSFWLQDPAKLLETTTKKFLKKLRKANMDAALIARFEGKGADFTPIDILAIDPTHWQIFTQRVGLKIITEYQKRLLTPLKKINTQIALADNVLRRIQDAMQGVAVKPFSVAEQSAAVRFFYDFCDGLAKSLIDDPANPLTNGRDLKTLENYPQGVDEVSISMEQAKRFLSACVGSPASKWHAQLHIHDNDIFEDQQQLAAFMLVRGRSFSQEFMQIYPSELFGPNFDKLIDNAHNCNSKIMDAKTEYDASTPALVGSENLIGPLAYALFLGDATGLP